MGPYEKLARKYSKVKYSPVRPRGTSITLLKSDLAGIRPSGQIQLGGMIDVRLQCPNCRAHFWAHLDLD